MSFPRTLAAVLAAWSLASFAMAQHPSYWVKDKVTTPRMFAEGVISTVDDEIAGAFSPDGSEFYFSKLVPYTTLPRIAVLCVSHFRDGHWSEPESLPFSGRYFDDPPKFDSTGKKLLFASSRPLPDGTRGGVRIWEVERDPNGWGEPKPLPAPINIADSYWNADPSEAGDGTLYFSSDRGSQGGTHIFRSKLMDGKYSEPEKLGPEINSEFSESQPYISPDGKTLIFASAGSQVPPFDHRPQDINTGGRPYLRADLYISFFRDGKWTQARHLEHGINSFAEEQFPFITPDGKYFFFSSERSAFTVPVPKKLTYDELERQMHSPLNGHGNVYFIGVEELEIPQ